MGNGRLAIRELDFEAEGSADPATLLLVGSADGRNVDALTSLIEALHADLVAAGARHVAVDLSRLEFMNASCFNVLVMWLSLVNEAKPEQRYELRFATNPAIPWQRRSLRTLSCFATDLVVVA
jgi:hypothetical protein